MQLLGLTLMCKQWNISIPVILNVLKCKCSLVIKNITVLQSYRKYAVRTAIAYFRGKSKAFDVINHVILLKELAGLRLHAPFNLYVDCKFFIWAHSISVKCWYIYNWSANY